MLDGGLDSLRSALVQGIHAGVKAESGDGDVDAVSVDCASARAANSHFNVVYGSQQSLLARGAR
jgi:hypothetical protein